MSFDIADSASEFTGIAFFAVAAWACWRAGRVAGSPWRQIAVLQAALLVEIVFRGRYHLHNLIDEIANAQGWYPQRTPVQLALIGFVIALAAIGWLVACRGRARGTRASIAVVATIAALLLFAVEAVSLHDIDALLYRQVGPVRAIALGWIAAASVVTLSALAAARS